MLTNNAEAREEYRNIWVVAEVLAGEIQKVTYELLGAARGLAEARGSEVWCVVLGNQISSQVDALFHGGADVALVVDDPSFMNFVDEDQATVLTRLIRTHKPEVVLCGATTRGRALIPRVAVDANCGLTADCTGLSIDPENGDLLQTRPAFGGNILATIRCSNHRPQMATVRPRVMNELPVDTSRTGRVITGKLEADEAGGLKQILKVFQDSENSVNLADARFIIAGGRGLKGADGFKMLKDLAERVHGAVGASRAAVDSGWVPYYHQVGQTGQTVQATVYFACGISGQIQHLVGMQSCDFIIAIDRNPDTPLMQLADVAVVGDLFEIIPQLIKEISRT
ncbi:MAG: electron transfer flavoprotein subunit alpha/FixB family protein [Spirochaetaceae bacterium]|nr:MAG: electron transfer flavoprotein subunit alpha/FixB family protein [Spirochaetaceae bacterium]